MIREKWNQGDRLVAKYGLQCVVHSEGKPLTENEARDLSRLTLNRIEAPIISVESERDGRTWWIRSGPSEVPPTKLEARIAALKAVDADKP